MKFANSWISQVPFVQGVTSQGWDPELPGPQEKEASEQRPEWIDSGMEVEASLGPMLVAGDLRREQGTLNPPLSTLPIASECHPLPLILLAAFWQLDTHCVTSSCCTNQRAREAAPLHVLCTVCSPLAYASPGLEDSAWSLMDEYAVLTEPGKSSPRHWPRYWFMNNRLTQVFKVNFKVKMYWLTDEYLWELQWGLIVHSTTQEHYYLILSSWILLLCWLRSE